MISFLEF